MKETSPRLLFACLLPIAAGCCCTSGDISTEDGLASLDVEAPVVTAPPPTDSEANVPQGPLPDDDPQASLDWFVQRYREELPKIESNPYQDDANNREERAVYQPLSHEAELVASESADQPHQATVTMKIKSLERYDGSDHESFTTDYRLRLVASENLWEIERIEMYDPNFESWDELSDLAWDKPLFDAAKIVYGLEVDPF